MNRSIPLSICLIIGILSQRLHADGVQARLNNTADKEQYVSAVTRGEGYMPWQKPGISDAEQAFRMEIENMKDEYLAARTTVEHPVLLTKENLERARRNIEQNDSARNWFAGHKRLADAVASRPNGYVENMISELTPANTYGFTCPNCVGKDSQECAGSSLIDWSPDNPDVIRCRRCGQVYPDEKYPETAVLRCPRMGQEFTYYLNDRERLHPDDRTGQYAWHWVGYPMHISFSGVVRTEKCEYMLTALRSLALVYALESDPKYAAPAIEILTRLAHCYRNWLYHDYWDTIADCDPLYAAWHDRELPLEWKRHLCANAFANDSLDKAAMLQGYWGAGRYHPSTDNIGVLASICLAYDLLYNASDTQGNALWTSDMRSIVERDLILEWELGAEPYLGGHNKAENSNNKAPRIYHAQAAVAKCLGIPVLADTALRGYQVVRDESFLNDGFSTESPSYTDMYLSELLCIPEVLYGFVWPDGYSGRDGKVDLYRTDTRLQLMYRSVVDQLRPDGRFLPLSDTNEQSGPSAGIIEIGLARYPQCFESRLPGSLFAGLPTEYGIFHFNSLVFSAPSDLVMPEILFPAWMTAILRHGAGPLSSVAAFPFNPEGGHRHDDNLALFYVDCGRTILGDLGYVGDMPVNAWIKSSLSHNLVIVDDKGQVQKGRRPSLFMMATSPGISVCEASSNGIYESCSEYRRLIAMIKGPDSHSFLVDIFRVTGGAKHIYRIFSELASSDVADASLSFEGLSMPDEPPLPQVGGSLEREDIFGLRDVRAADNPPPSWSAVWQETDRRYRLRMLCPVHRVEASNGPGQRTLSESGRRVRYVDSIRQGENLRSTFVAIHEPCGGNGNLPILAAERLEVPPSAGEKAIAIKILSTWGEYLILSEFAEETIVKDIRFQGRFGVYCRPSGGSNWLFALGAKTLIQETFGFSDMPAEWHGGVENNSESVVVSTTARPAKWPDESKEVRNYLIASDGKYTTGFPVGEIREKEIHTTRFPLPPLETFQVFAVQYIKE
ncbi:MAG TPA: heparinase II/III family protein [bacterium]|nr:heparinase II/III family protein [bacterium]HQL60874.1 heparinase II/III family protein [bacterium]